MAPPCVFVLPPIVCLVGTQPTCRKGDRSSNYITIRLWCFVLPKSYGPRSETCSETIRQHNHPTPSSPLAALIPALSPATLSASRTMTAFRPLTRPAARRSITTASATKLPRSQSAEFLKDVEILAQRGQNSKGQNSEGPIFAISSQFKTQRGQNSKGPICCASGNVAFVSQFFLYAKL